MTTTNNQEPLGGDLKEALNEAIGEHVRTSEEMMCELPAPGAKKRWLESREALDVAIEAVFASKQAGAAGASEVKPWQDRTDEITPTAVVMAMEQEIADLRAQLARQRQDWQTVQGMADCMDMVRQELIEAGVINKSVPPMMIANAVVEHIARQRQGSGEPVAWLWEYIGPDGYARANSLVARHVREMDPKNPPHPDTWKPVAPLYTAPAAQAQGEPAEVRQYRGVGQLAWLDLTPGLEAPELYQFRTLYTAPVAQGEPVAWITFRTKDGRETLKEGCVATNRAYTEAHSQWVWEPLGRLVKPSAQADEGRDAALEEAAKICEDEDHKYELGRSCAVAIRALKRTTAADNQKGDSNA